MWFTVANFMRLRKLRVANAVSISLGTILFFVGGTWIKSLRYLQSSRKLRDVPWREIAASSFPRTLSTLFTYRYESHWAGRKVLLSLWLDSFNIDKICLVRIITKFASIARISCWTILFSNNVYKTCSSVPIINFLIFF